MEKKYYLKCRYSKGMFSGEYFIKFNSKPQNWCFVAKEDVKPVDKTKGLVKLASLSSKTKGDKILAGIVDVGDHRISSFYVSKEDVCCREL